MKKLLAFAAAITFLAVLALPVSAQEELPCTPVAHGQNAAGCTVTFKNQTQTLVDVIPCTNTPAVITITNANSIFHITTLANGTFWATFTMEGQFTAVPAVGPTFSGHFAAWDGENLNLNNATMTATFNVTGKGSDGSTLSAHAMIHVNFDATGQPHMSFHFGC
jgi:hypothetical protein